MRPGERRTRHCSRRRGMISFWNSKLTGAPPLLSLVVGLSRGILNAKLPMHDGNESGNHIGCKACERLQD